MFKLVSKITFDDGADLEPLQFVNNVEIETSWQTFTDTATLTLPFKLKNNGEVITVGSSGLFKRGTKVKIELGYLPNLVTEFEGYISNILPDSPLVIECQDASWLLKQSTITKSEKGADLGDFLEAVVDGVIEINAVEANIGAMRLTRVTALQVLEELKKTYGLVSFVRGGILRSGLAYYPEESAEHEIIFQRNVISSNLEYVNRDDIKIKVKAISILPDNTKLEAEAGDDGGTTRTFFAYNITDTKALQTFADNELTKLSFDGYRGDFETFGEPSIQHGDLVTLKDNKFPEREGRYLVDSVTKSFGMNGYRQSVTLGPVN